LEGVFPDPAVHPARACRKGRGTCCRCCSSAASTTGDVIALEPFLASGLLAPATYVPPVGRGQPHRVLALMAYSAGAQRFRSDTFALDRFFEFEDEQIADAGADY
jgi:hypothetical protein